MLGSYITLGIIVCISATTSVRGGMTMFFFIVTKGSFSMVIASTSTSFPA